MSAVHERVLAQLDEDAAEIDFDRPDWYRGLEHLDVTMAEYLARLNLPVRAREDLLAGLVRVDGRRRTLLPHRERPTRRDESRLRPDRRDDHVAWISRDPLVDQLALWALG